MEFVQLYYGVKMDVAVLKVDNDYKASYDLLENENMYILINNRQIEEEDGKILAKVFHWIDGTITVSQDGEEWTSQTDLWETMENIADSVSNY